MNPRDTYRDSLHLTSWGELLWDVYAEGPRLGGAPANLAFHAQRLGAKSCLITKVGDDELGSRALSELVSKGIIVESGRRSVYPTGQVHVDLSRGEPRYTILAPAAYDEIETNAATRRIFETSDYFCFGTLALRQPASLGALLALLDSERGATRPKLVVDLNLRPPHSSKESVIFCLEHAELVKLNQDEYLELERWLDVTDVRLALFERFHVELLLVTRGAEGATLYAAELTLNQPATAADAKDPVGAGDAFLSAFLVNLGGQPELSVSLERAARYAARVSEEPGAMPELPLDFRRACSPFTLEDEVRPIGHPSRDSGSAKS